MAHMITWDCSCWRLRTGSCTIRADVSCLPCQASALSIIARFIDGVTVVRAATQGPLRHLERAVNNMILLTSSSHDFLSLDRGFSLRDPLPNYQSCDDGECADMCDPTGVD
ncbi:hypothetical protein IF2G_00531 [Cordyceps javanica]|nr:hypothetical protein IF2G_00531 [Cordyceps javanica]